MPQTARALPRQIHDAKQFLLAYGVETRSQAKRWMKRNPTHQDHARIGQAAKLAFPNNGKPRNQ